MGKRIPGRLALVVLAGGLTTGLPVSGALAQTMSPSATERGVTVLTRPRPEYDPLGVRLGGFRLDAAVEAGAGWDSNLFGRRRNVVSDGYATESANIELGSDWTTHALGASVNMESRQYFSRGDQDWTDWNVGGFGRYDFSAYTNVEARYRHFRQHLDVWSFDVQSSGISVPVPYDSDEVQVGGSTRFNRLGLLAIGNFRTYRFEDVTVSGVRTPVSINDFNTAVGSFGASYAVAPGRFITGIVRLQDIDYLNNVSNPRDSFTWEALLGFQYDFDGVWQGRIALGWRHRDYRGPGIKPLEGLAAEGELIWLPTQLTTVSLNVRRTIEESIRADAVSYVRTGGGIRVDHELLRNVILGGELRADRYEYESPRQTATDGSFILSARYAINRNLAVVGAYSFIKRLEASGGLPEFDRNLIQVRLRIAL